MRFERAQWLVAQIKETTGTIIDFSDAEITPTFISDNEWHVLVALERWEFTVLSVEGWDDVVASLREAK